MTVTPMDLDKLASLSDEELEKLSAPEIPSEAQAATPALEEAPVAPEASAEEQAELAAEETLESASGEEEEPEAVPETQTPAEPPAATETPTATPAAAQSSTDYKSAYEKVMAPFKANGKTHKLESVDEVVQLMQMGANYTKKMQELQSVRKYVMMLQNNGLLDEDKISYLIDLDKKSPEAIKKLLVDAKIDPLELDTSNVDYRSTGAHKVSDQEVTLDSTVSDLNSQEGGPELLQSVQKWDQASKKVLWEDPEILQALHQHRLDGTYAKITDEMERRQLLGQLPANAPFLAAYKHVGDQLFGPGAQQQQPPVPQAPVAVRAAPAKTSGTTAADPRVKAAAPTRTSPRTTQPQVNYLALSDEEFAKLPPPKM